MRHIAPSDVDAALVARVAADAALHFGLPAPPQLAAAWEIRNPYSTVLRLELRLGDWSRRFFAKLATGPEVSPTRLSRQLQNEYDVLVRLTTNNVEGALVGSVVPLAIYADPPSLVTIEAQGWTLRKVYARYARVLGRSAVRVRLVDLARLCGTWLAGFHATTAVGQGDIEVDPLLAYCRIRLGALRNRHPNVLSQAQVTALESSAHDLARRIPSSSLRISRRHNDFASHNIIALDTGGIRVLDFQSSDHNVNAFDVCNYWFELELLKFDPTYSVRLLTRMQRVFLDAYGQVGSEQPDFQLARLRYSINRLLNELDSAQGWQRLSLRRRRCIHGTKLWVLAFARGDCFPAYLGSKSGNY